MSSKSIYTPYTYLIGWSSHNKFYYGVRYAKGCTPDDLFSTYFTSSKYVKSMVSKHGNPDIIQIRRTFTDSTSARLWEDRVLRRLDVVPDHKFLNKTTNKSICPVAASAHCKGKTYEEIYGVEKAKELRNKRSKALSGRTRSVESNKKQSASMKGKMVGKKNPTATPISILYKGTKMDFDIIQDCAGFLIENTGHTYSQVMSCMNRKRKGIDTTNRHAFKELYACFKLFRQPPGQYQFH